MKFRSTALHRTIKSLAVLECSEWSFECSVAVLNLIEIETRDWASRFPLLELRRLVRSSPLFGLFPGFPEGGLVAFEGIHEILHGIASHHCGHRGRSRCCEGILDVRGRIIWRQTWILDAAGRRIIRTEGRGEGSEGTWGNGGQCSIGGRCRDVEGCRCRR